MNKLKLLKYARYKREVLDEKVKNITEKYKMSKEDLEELSAIISVITTQEFSKAGIIK